MLEVGCGEGELARELAARGYEVVAIDPHAPPGPIFRAITLEELDPRERFDAVVASRSFHHMENLRANLATAARIAPLFVLDEFAWDRLDEATGHWYEGQRRVLAASGLEPPGAPVAEWERHHADVHAFDVLRSALGERFDELRFEWTPYLWRYLGGPATPALEESLIAAGAIQPLGFRFVGIARAAATLESS